MKSIHGNLLLGLAIFIAAAAAPATYKTTTIIRWTSNTYTDYTTGGEVHMANEFVCSQKSLYWSLFGKDIALSGVSWRLDDSMKGHITYMVADPDMNGTITFNFNSQMAEVHLRSSVGLIHYGLKMDTIQDESK